MSEQETGMIVVDETTARQIDQLEAWSRNVTVKTEAEKAAVLEIVRGVKAQRKTLDEFFDPGIKKAHELHKGLVAQKKQFTDRLDTAEAAGKRAMLAFDQEQARIREEERRRLQAIADEQARKERERLEKEAVRLKTPEKQAERLEQAAAVAAPVVQVAEAPKAEGASTRKIWKARVVDVALVPREFMIVNEKALDAMAKATKGATPVAGVEFYAEEVMAIR
jgi:hypothetical protein